MVRIQATLHPEEAAIVWAALDRIARERVRRLPSSEDADVAGGEGPATDTKVAATADADDTRVDATAPAATTIFNHGGREIIEAPPPPAVVNLGWTAILEANDDLDIDRDTNECLWDGRDLNYAWTVDDLVKLDGLK